MNVSETLRGIGVASFVEVICPTCGAKTVMRPDLGEGICNFCEAYVQNSVFDKQHVPQKADPALVAIQTAMTSNQWGKVLEGLELFSTNGDPTRLYGAASIYARLSDFVYNSVNYNLPGFMYSNADSRNDEPDRNKYNSMYLASKSREMLFEALYIINSHSVSTDEKVAFLAFMSEIKLNRFPQASKILKRISAGGRDDLITKYSLMVYFVETNNATAVHSLDKLLSRQELNALYYLARYLLNKNSIETANNVLEQLLSRSEMPAGVRLYAKVQQSIEESRL